MKHDAKLNRDINMESDAGTSPTVARYFRTMSELADRQYRPSVPPALAHSLRLGDLAQARRRAELAWGLGCLAAAASVVLVIGLGQEMTEGLALLLMWI